MKPFNCSKFEAVLDLEFQFGSITQMGLRLKVQVQIWIGIQSFTKFERALLLISSVHVMTSYWHNSVPSLTQFYHTHMEMQCQAAAPRVCYKLLQVSHYPFSLPCCCKSGMLVPFTSPSLPGHLKGQKRILPVLLCPLVKGRTPVISIPLALCKSTRISVI